MIKEYASFHNHSHFSVMDGISLPEEMIRAAKEKGIKAIGITDHGHCHAHADFYLAGKKQGVRTVFGVEAYVIDDIAQWAIDKESGEAEDAPEIDTNARIDVKRTKVSKYRKGHLVLLACNRTGLANIYQLTYLSHRDGFYGKPRMDKKMLMAHSEGVIATSACMGGVISLKCWDLKAGLCTYDDIVKEAREFDAIFGRGRFFLELQFNEADEQRFINDILVRIHNDTGIPLTVTADAHYVNPEDWKAQELLYMLRGKQTMKTKVKEHTVRQLYIKSAEEMWISFQKFGGALPEKTAIEAFQNTLLIDSLIENYEPDTHKRLPTLKDVNEPFRKLGENSIQGLKDLGLANKDEYKKRLLHELKIIKDKGFANYFLTMEKIIKEAKKTMLVGEGRGSSGASLVCYCLGITDIDPIHHDLLFERFMDPARTEEPDIDTDFEDIDATKDMLRKMFGPDNVACLSAYGTFQIKGLLKDLGRVYDVDNRVINDANKKIEKELKVLYINQDKSTLVVKLDDVERVSPTFTKLVQEYPQVGEHMKKLYGRNRQVGRHASGVIIGDNLPAETALFVTKSKDLAENIRSNGGGKAKEGEEGRRIVQASFTEGIINKNISAMGFTKFDILGLATLEILHFCFDLVAKKEGVSFEDVRQRLRSKNMNLDDPKIMKHVFHDGNFAGIFQFTEKGIRRVAKNVKPDTFVDISAIVSIYRPGPLAGGFDKLYAHNKQHPEDVAYGHPLLESILKKTRGCIVFQEQLMQICNVLGKMSWKDVNAVRKVLLKKDKSKTEEFLKGENERLSGLFFKGCEENGFPKDKADKLWKDLIAFGGYGFNKAHSDAYSVMTMQCAYLATYHQMEWYAAVLSKGQSGDLQQYVGDIKRAGVKVLPVCINESKEDNVIDVGANAIRLSLGTVKGVGKSAIDKILAGQPYADFPDFLERSGATKTAIDPLIRAGAFDSICPNMQDLDINYTILTEETQYKRKKKPKDWPISKYFGDWLEFFKPENQYEDYQLYEKVAFENELFGFSLRGSPFEVLDRSTKILRYLEEKLGMPTDIYYGVDLDDALGSSSEVISLPVLCKRVFEKAQRNGQMMAFLTFETMEGKEFDCPCFSTIWRNISKRVKVGNVYMGMFNRKFGEDPNNLLVGKPGFGHSVASSQNYMLPVDELKL